MAMIATDAATRAVRITIAGATIPGGPGTLATDFYLFDSFVDTTRLIALRAVGPRIGDKGH